MDFSKFTRENIVKSQIETWENTQDEQEITVPVKCRYKGISKQMATNPEIVFVGVRGYVPNPLGGPASLYAPIRCCRTSREFYREAYRQQLEATNMYHPVEIDAIVDGANFKEIRFQPGNIPFVIDDALPSGRAYFELIGQNS